MPEILLFNMFNFLLILLAFVTIVFLLATYKRDNSIMDIAYGPAFTISFILSAETDKFSTTDLMILAIVAVWSLRLFLRIFFKNFGKPEDQRYATWRQEWMKKGYHYFLLRSYLQINLLQAIIIFLVATPLLITSSTSIDTPNHWLIFGSLVSAFGLIYETIADWQLDRFIKNKKNGSERSVILTTGLFKYSRRPNYFGETLIWWGLAIIVFPLPYGWLAIISPLLITYIVTSITGPMLEKIFLEKYPTEYKEYMEKTNYFLPKWC